MNATHLYIIKIMYNRMIATTMLNRERPKTFPLRYMTSVIYFYSI